MKKSKALHLATFDSPHDLWKEWTQSSRHRESMSDLMTCGVDSKEIRHMSLWKNESATTSLSGTAVTDEETCDADENGDCLDDVKLEDSTLFQQHAECQYPPPRPREGKALSKQISWTINSRDCRRQPSDKQSTLAIEKTSEKGHIARDQTNSCQFSPLRDCIRVISSRFGHPDCPKLMPDGYVLGKEDISTKESSSVPDNSENNFCSFISLMIKQQEELWEQIKNKGQAKHSVKAISRIRSRAYTSNKASHCCMKQQNHSKVGPFPIIDIICAVCGRLLMIPEDARLGMIYCPECRSVAPLDMYLDLLRMK